MFRWLEHKQLKSILWLYCSFFVFAHKVYHCTLPWPYQDAFIGEPLLTSLAAQPLISMISVRINNFFSCLTLFTFFFYKSILCVMCCSAATTLSPHQYKTNIDSIQFLLVPVKMPVTSGTISFFI